MVARQINRERSVGNVDAIVHTGEGTNRRKGSALLLPEGAAKRDEKRLYHWTAIDECTGLGLYGYDEHTPKNLNDFLKRVQNNLNFAIKTIQTGNGTEFMYRFISETEKSVFEKARIKEWIAHKLIPPRTPWHDDLPRGKSPYSFDKIEYLLRVLAAVRFNAAADVHAKRVRHF